MLKKWLTYLFSFIIAAISMQAIISIFVILSFLKKFPDYVNVIALASGCCLSLIVGFIVFKKVKGHLSKDLL
jgi:hypothetical protein